MKLYATFLLLRKTGLRALLLLVVVITTFPLTVRAETNGAVTDSLKKEIRRLVQAKSYGQAATAYEQLGGLYTQLYGYNKYTMDSYFNALKYYNLVGDSVGYYREHIMIGDYYTHDYFMRSYAEKYLTKARQFFERTHDVPKVLDCRLGLVNIAQQKSAAPKILLTELHDIERMSGQHKQAYSQAYALNLLANTFSLLKMPDSAQYFASRSLVIAQRLNVRGLISLNYF